MRLTGTAEFCIMNIQFYWDSFASFEEDVQYPNKSASVLEIAERAEGGKTMSEVHIKENESLDSALRRFKRSCAKAGVLSELRKREHYESPSVKRRKKSEAARAKKRKFR